VIENFIVTYQDLW